MIVDTYFPDMSNMRTQSRKGRGLVGPFSSRKFVKRMAKDRLSFSRQSWGAKDEIDIETTDDNDLFHIGFCTDALA